MKMLLLLAAATLLAISAVQGLQHPYRSIGNCADFEENDECRPKVENSNTTLDEIGLAVRKTAIHLKNTKKVRSSKVNEGLDRLVGIPIYGGAHQFIRSLVAPDIPPKSPCRSTAGELNSASLIATVGNPIRIPTKGTSSHLMQVAMPPWLPAGPDIFHCSQGPQATLDALASIGSGIPKESLKKCCACAFNRQENVFSQKAGLLTIQCFTKDQELGKRPDAPMFTLTNVLDYVFAVLCVVTFFLAFALSLFVCRRKCIFVRVEYVLTKAERQRLREDPIRPKRKSKKLKPLSAVEPTDGIYDRPVSATTPLSTTPKSIGPKLSEPRSAGSQGSATRYPRPSESGGFAVKPGQDSQGGRSQGAISKQQTTANWPTAPRSQDLAFGATTAEYGGKTGVPSKALPVGTFAFPTAPVSKDLR